MNLETKLVIAVLQLGLLDYATSTHLQETLADLRKQNRIPNTLLLLEHPPVITLGRNAQALGTAESNILASREQLAARGIAVYETNRGGDVTFHGPGQLVGYPIFDLRSFPQPDSTLPSKTLGAVAFVRRVEEVLIRTCADFGIGTHRVEGRTGVWTQSTPESKIAAIGVHIARAVTTHGFALNVTTALDYFRLIVPCGITEKAVTSMTAELGREIDLAPVQESVMRNFGRVFNSQILWLESLEALLASAAEPASTEPTSVEEVIGVPLQTPPVIQHLRGEDAAVC